MQDEKTLNSVCSFTLSEKRPSNNFLHLYSYQFAIKENVSAREIMLISGLGAGSTAAIGTAGAVGAVAAADTAMGSRRR